MALDDVARLGLVVVVAQRRLYRQVQHRRVAYAVPSLLQFYGAHVELLDHVARDGELHRLVYHDGVGVLLREAGHAQSARHQPVAAAVDERRVAVHVGQHVALLPGQSVEQGAQVEQLLAGHVERYPVPACRQVEGLHILRAGPEEHRLVGTQHGAVLERDGRRRRQHQFAARRVLPQLEGQCPSARLVVIHRQVEVALARQCRIADVGEAVAASVLCEHAHDVSRVDVYLVVHQHAARDVH